MTKTYLKQSGRLPADATGLKSVTCLAWSPTQQLLAVGRRGSDVQVWDAGSGRQFALYSGSAGDVAAVAFSPDGTTIATGGDDAIVRVWEVATRSLLWLRVLEAATSTRPGIAKPRSEGFLEDYRDGLPSGGGGGYRVRALAWSPDGRHIAVGGQGSRPLYVLDAATGERERTIEGVERSMSWVKTIAWSPDGAIVLAAIPDQSLRLYDLATGVLLEDEEWFSRWQGALALSPEGERVAFGLDSGLVQMSRWLPGGGTQRLFTLKLQMTPYPVTAVAFSPGGRAVATCSSDGNMCVWSARTGEVLYRAPRESWVAVVAWSPDGTLLAGGTRAGYIQLWEVASSGTGIDRAIGEENETEAPLVLSRGERVVRTQRPFLSPTLEETALLNDMMGQRYLVEEVRERYIVLVTLDEGAHQLSVSSACLVAPYFQLFRDE